MIINSKTTKALQSAVGDLQAQTRQIAEQGQLLMEKADLTAQTLTGVLETLSGANERIAQLEQGSAAGANEQIALLQILQQRLAELSQQSDANFAQLSQNAAVAVGAILGAQAADAPALAPPTGGVALDESTARMQADYPKLYPLWEERLQAMKDAYLAHGKPGNAAYGGDPAANYFRYFVQSNYRGRLLDVGCGVHGRPYYLADLDSARIAGMDPLEAIEPVDFLRVTGVGEYIPWPAASFETVVSGTSLDHCIDIDRTLAEFARVLGPGGNLLVWVAYVKGAKPFAPDDPDWTPEDVFHLYHADEGWFEPLLLSRFEVRQKIKFYAQSFDHCFYELVRLPSDSD